MNTAYYRRCSGLLLLYDVSNELSFTRLSRWLDEVKEYSPENVQIMVLYGVTSVIWLKADR